GFFRFQCDLVCAPGRNYARRRRGVARAKEAAMSQRPALFHIDPVAPRGPVTPRARFARPHRSVQHKFTMMCGLISALTVSLIAFFMLRFQEQSAKRVLRQRATELTAALEPTAITAALADDYALIIKKMQDL